MPLTCFSNDLEVKKVLAVRLSHTVKFISSDGEFIAAGDVMTSIVYQSLKDDTQFGEYKMKDKSQKSLLHSSH